MYNKLTWLKTYQERVEGIGLLILQQPAFVKESKVLIPTFNLLKERYLSIFKKLYFVASFSSNEGREFKIGILNS